MWMVKLAIYIIAAIALCGLGAYQLNKMQYTISAFLFVACAGFICILYGLRWFGSDPASVFSSTPGSWPPMINTCPDYLTFYMRDVGGVKKKTCIDTIGVSRNGTLKVFVKDSTGAAPSGDESYFSLDTTTTETTARNKELCQRAISNGLTWEGITNGESCV